MPSAVVPQRVPYGSTAFLLTRNNTGHNHFLTHLDRSPIGRKKSTFVFPFILNLVFAAILGYRIYNGGRELLAAFVSGQLFSTSSTKTIVRRILHLVIDYFLVRWLGPYITDFFGGHLLMRLKHGFHETEVVFRKPTGISMSFLKNRPAATYLVEWNRVLKEAMDPTRLDNVGENTLHDFWVLDYKAASDAYTSAKMGLVDIKTWERSHWEFINDRWMVSEYWRVDESQTESAQQGTSTQQSAAGPQGNVAGAAVLNHIKTKLESLGKGFLYDEWVAAIRDSANRQPNAAAPSDIGAELFAKEGLDLRALIIEAASASGLGVVNSSTQQ